MFLDTGKAVTTAAFSPDGRQLVTGSDEKGASIWDLDSGRLLVALEGHTTRVNSAEYSPDGRRILTASNDRTARIWDVATGRQTLLLSGHAGAVEWAVFSRDGRRVATASRDQTARIWDATTGRQLLQLSGHTADVGTVRFSPDGQQIVTSSGDRTARIWDAASGVQLNELRGHRDVLSEAVFSPDGRRVATSSWDHTVRIWDSRTGQLLTVLSGHTDAVNDVAFSPDGKLLISASDDKTARVWTAQTASLRSQISWSEAAQFDPLSSDERLQLGLPASPEVRHWDTGSIKCDEMAAAPYDPERRAPGVALANIVVDIALRSCSPREAHEAMSDRLVYQHGRALMASGSYEAARKDFDDARGRGYRAAQIDLAKLPLRPEAGVVDVAGAVSLLEHAWTDGMAIAAFELGDLYERGVKASSDPTKYLLTPDAGRAWSWYGKAAQAGEPNAIARRAQRVDWNAQQSPTVAGRDELWLEAFRLYATAAERARIEDWPAALWRDWRYRRASLARLLEAEGMMQRVAEAYDAVRQQQAPPASTVWARLHTFHRENQ
jgi:TPR repeat protein/sugar lactone lactonase YvrE